jgi:hypothetical protein
MAQLVEQGQGSEFKTPVLKKKKREKEGGRPALTPPWFSGGDPRLPGLGAAGLRLTL